MTEGRLKKSKSSFNPESGQITLSLKLTDRAWKPRQGFEKWDHNTRTFREVSLFQIITTHYQYHYEIWYVQYLKKLTDLL